MANRLSGSWARRAADTPLQPLVPGVDPQHLQPDPDPNLVPGHAPMWVSTAGAPDLPPELYPDPAPDMPVGEGPVDHTPEDHLYGVGFGHGLTIDEALEEREVHLEDDGAVAADSWHHMIERDGQPHADFIDDALGNGASPETLIYQQTGVGSPIDPNARRGRRLWRWYDRTIDFHRWQAQQGPVGPRYAQPTAAQPAVPDGTQYDMPFPTAVTYSVGAPDRFVQPLIRRAPASPWGVGLESDGTVESIAGAADAYGLTTWGA